MMGLFGNPRFQQPYPTGPSLWDMDRTNPMPSQSMGLLGMDLNYPNMVGPTSAWAAQAAPSQIPQASQLTMPGWEYQQSLLNQTPTPTPDPVQSLFGTWYRNPYGGQSWTPHEFATPREQHIWMLDQSSHGNHGGGGE